MTRFRNVHLTIGLTQRAPKAFIILAVVALLAPLVISVTWSNNSLTLTPAQASVGRQITLPIPIADKSRVSWTDTWGAPRSGGRSHIGVDMLGPKMVPLLAANDGTITWGRFDNSGGNILRMRDNAGWEYQYIHINNDSPGTDNGSAKCTEAFSAKICAGISGGSLPKGMALKAGEVIGYMGDSGNAEWTASHLHFEVYNPSGVAVNPTPYVDDALARQTSQTPPTPTTVPAPKDDPVKTSPPSKAVGPWVSSNVAAQKILIALEGRTPTLKERQELRKQIDRQGLEVAIAKRSVGSPIAQIDRLYLTLFKRNADASGLIHWLKQSGNGVTLEQIAYNFSVSEEFNRRYPATSTSQFVTMLYKDLYNKSPDKATLARLIAKVDSGRKGRGEFVLQISESKAMLAKAKSRSEVTAAHRVFSKQVPRAHHIERWKKLRRKANLPTVIRQKFL